MNYHDYKILQILSDYNYHSGENLAKVFNTTRAAICKRVSKINNFLSQCSDLYINTLVGKGYCLNKVFDYLDLDYISQNILNKNINLKFFPSIDSTNNFLLSNKLDSDKYNIVISEHQSAGRGRMSLFTSNNISENNKKKYWYSPFGNNIYLSIGCYYTGVQYGLLGLSLIIGIIIAEVLEDIFKTLDINPVNIGLKWPNDVYINNKKIAGILTEIQGDPNGSCKLIIGMGINIYHNKNNNDNIDQPWIALDQVIDNNLNRNIIIAKIIDKFVNYYQDFIQTGLNKFIEKWQKYDILAGKFIELINNNTDRKTGLALGIDNQGALLVNISGVNQVFHSGEISVKAV